MWKEINATILDLVSTKRVHTFNHWHKRKLISESHAGGLGSLCSSFIIGTVSIFVQVQTTCRWYSTPANYRADFKDWLIYSRTFPPPPFPSSFQTGTVKAQTAVMLCPVVFIQPSYNSYLSSSSQLLFSTLILGPENEAKCPTMNKTTALFSVPHGNLITWYKHFIVSKLILHQSPFFWHWNEKCGLCTELNPRLHSAPLTMCVSQHLGPRWIARPAIEVVFCWAVLSSQAFRKASDQETTVLALACTPGTLHPTRAPLNWPWVAGVIKGGWGGGEAGVGGWGCVCLWKETFC